MNRVHVAAAIVAVLSSTALSARADEPPASAENAAAAKELFDEGLRLMDAGSFTSACAKFAASEQNVARISTLLNLGNCYEKTGQLASAWGIYNEATTFAQRTARPDFETFAKERIAAIEPKLLRLAVVVDDRAKIEGLVITRDGAAVSEGEWGASVPVDPGQHHIHASAPKKTPWDATVSVDQTTARATVTVPRLEDVPEAPPPAPLVAPVAPSPNRPSASPPPAPPPSYWTPQRTLGVALGGVGVAAVVGGGLLGLVAKGHYADARGQCTDAPSVCPQAAVDQSNGAYSLATGATVTFVLGMAFAASGAVVFFTAPTPRAPAEASPSVALSPFFAPGVAGMGARGAW
jgi:hypothetical protein